jgi:Zn-dependent oligopeptidase
MQVLEKQTLGGMAKHWKTGAPIPAELVEKVRAAKTYRAAYAMVRQLTFALSDLAIHSADFKVRAAEGCCLSLLPTACRCLSPMAAPMATDCHRWPLTVTDVH